MEHSPDPVGVIYIARGADPNWRERIARFVRSWQAHPPGQPYRLYVNHKEYASREDMVWAIEQFIPVDAVNILEFERFNSWGGGCFQEACASVVEQNICTLVSTTEIMHNFWLKDLSDAYSLEGVGIAGCTGSRVSTPHIRDTAIIVDKEQYLQISRQFDFKHSKDDYLEFEHGPNNLTQQIIRSGKREIIVEKHRWLTLADCHPTNYQGNLANVLVHDRGARDFNDL